MAQTKITQKRTIEETVSALECDVCSDVYARGDANYGAMSGAVSTPVNSGQFIIWTLNSHENQVLMLCPPCAAVTWDWLQERKK